MITLYYQRGKCQDCGEVIVFDYENSIISCHCTYQVALMTDEKLSESFFCIPAFKDLPDHSYMQKYDLLPEDIYKAQVRALNIALNCLDKKYWETKNKLVEKESQVSRRNMQIKELKKDKKQGILEGLNLALRLAKYAKDNKSCDIIGTLESHIENLYCEHEGETKRGICLDCGADL